MITNDYQHANGKGYSPVEKKVSKFCDIVNLASQSFELLV